MRASQQYVLSAACGVLAIASAAAVRTLDHFGIIVIVPAPELAHEAALPDGEAAAEQAATNGLRFSYLPVETGALPTATETALLHTAEPPPEMPEGLEAPESEDESASAWTAETRPERAAPGANGVQPSAPKQKSAAVERLPWSGTGPSPAAQPSAQPPARVYSLKERLGEIQPGASKRLQERFEAAKVAWLPAEVGLVAIKDEKTLELHVRASGGPWQFVHSYPVLAASGSTGPKLRRGDHQVPEGIYGISFLNPNSRYHVSMRVSYPNAFDRRMADKDGRKDLGGDIMIHGKAVSAGCLAMGDEAAEDLFTLAARMELQQIEVLICPQDFRTKPQPRSTEKRDWVLNLYEELKVRLSEFPVPPPP